jgi:regulatory protein
MRPHSVGELTEKLKRHGFQPELITKVLKKFRLMGALDDDKYALSLAERMLEQRPCGKSMLLAHLYRKKIERELAEQVVEMVLRGREENELAKASLQKRWSVLGQIELETARRRAYNYLSRRGFSYQAARTAFEELSKRTDEGMSD